MRKLLFIVPDMQSRYHEEEGRDHIDIRRAPF